MGGRQDMVFQQLLLIKGRAGAWDPREFKRIYFKAEDGRDSGHYYREKPWETEVEELKKWEKVVLLG